LSPDIDVNWVPRMEISNYVVMVEWPFLRVIVNVPVRHVFPPPITPCREGISVATKMPSQFTHLPQLLIAVGVCFCRYAWSRITPVLGESVGLFEPVDPVPEAHTRG